MLEKYSQIRIYIERSKINDTDVAISVIPPLLAYYENLFDLPYPLDKLGMFPFSEVLVNC